MSSDRWLGAGDEGVERLGKQAAQREWLAEACDVVLWSGHGAPGSVRLRRPAQVAMEAPAMEAPAFLVPGLANGNGRIYLELGEIRKRLEVVEGKVDRVLRGTGPGEAGRGGDARVAALARAG